MIEKRNSAHTSSDKPCVQLSLIFDIWTVEIIYIIQNSGSMYLLSDARREN